MQSSRRIDPSPSPLPKGEGVHGFTLAEVLITLGIIGVVAALTLPTLIQNYKKQEASARLKKFYSMMSQAVQMAEANEGSKSYEWDVDSQAFNKFETEEDIDAVVDFSYKYWNKYLAPYIKTLNVKKGLFGDKKDEYSGTKVYLPDGSSVGFAPGAAVDVLFDINGDAKPNEYGKDKFLFLITTSSTYLNGRVHEFYPGRSFGVGWLPVYNTREKAYEACKTKPIVCPTLLFYDNWEFKDDYPYKL